MSLPCSLFMTGRILWMSSYSGEANRASRAVIQLTLPSFVLISPLCEIIRYGWASSQLGNVFVLNREWNMHIALIRCGLDRSG